jgi:hypothetical protein
MDWLSFTCWRAVNIILEHHQGKDAAMLTNEYNTKFLQSYNSWFQALYKDKYDYIGDFDLMRTAFLLDLGLYYLGVAGPLYTEGRHALDYGVFITPPSRPVFRLMSLYNRRLAAIARKRRELGTFGQRNDRQRFMFGGYTFARDGANSKPIVKALMYWGWLELTEGWRSWFTREHAATAPVNAARAVSQAAP